MLNITKQKTTQVSPLNLLVGMDGATPVIRSLIRDVAADDARPNRAAWREMCRTRASELLRRNRTHRDARVNAKLHLAGLFQFDDLVFVINYSQATGKLVPGMRGPYRVQRALASGRYELKSLSGSYGKTMQAAAECMVLWRGEWRPESCAALFESEILTIFVNVCLKSCGLDCHLHILALLITVWPLAPYLKHYNVRLPNLTLTDLTDRTCNGNTNHNIRSIGLDG